jgi:hypothetical protein
MFTTLAMNRKKMPSMISNRAAKAPRDEGFCEHILKTWPKKRPLQKVPQTAIILSNNPW